MSKTTKTSGHTTEQVARVIDACKTQLAINFDVPARDIVCVYGAKIGLGYDEMRQLLRDTIQA